MKHLLPILCVVLLALACAAFAQNQDARTVQCRALDALGEPIPNALIQTWDLEFERENPPPPADTASTTTDDGGNFALPEKARLSAYVVRMSHPDYGMAESQFDQGNVVAFPVVKKGSVAENHAIKGVVLDPEKKPVAGLRVQITGVNAGIRSIAICRMAAYTDKAGRFCLYPATFWSPTSGSQFPETFPPDTTCYLMFIQPDYSLFPAWRHFKMGEEAVITLDRAEFEHRFVFRGSDDEPLEPDRMRLDYCNDKDAGPSMLPARFAEERVKLAPGRYWASYYDTEEGVVCFPWISVTKDSPEELVFRVPKTVTFTGRVLDGVTGKPLPRAFVMVAPWRRPFMENNLARLTAQDWQALHALPDAPDLKDPALSSFLKLYYARALARTDADGKYAIALPWDNKWGGDVVAFDEGLLPAATNAYEADMDGRNAVSDMLLFPAACIIVKPVIGEGLPKPGFIRFDYEWGFDEQGQPEWFSRFPKGEHSRPRSTYDRHWFYQMTPGEEEPFLIPAGLRMYVKFSPLVDQWHAPRKFPPMILERGETRNLNELTILPSFKVFVKVADSRGKPLPGIPVRQHQEGSDEWSEPRRTGADGMAQFCGAPGSSGRFGMVELALRLPAAEEAMLEVAYHVPDAVAPAEPYIITLTDGQIQQVQKLRVPPEMR